MSTPRRAGYTPGLAGELFWLSVTSLLTFGVSLAATPDVLNRHQTNIPDLALECSTAWSEVLRRFPSSAYDETRESVLGDLRLGVKGELARRGRPLQVEVADGPTDNNLGVNELRMLGTKRSAPVVTVADVSFGAALRGSDCTFVLRASTTLHLEPTEVPAPKVPPQSVTLTREASVPVKQWASDPEIERRTRQDMLAELGKSLVAVLLGSRSGPN